MVSLQPDAGHAVCPHGAREGRFLSPGYAHPADVSLSPLGPGASISQAASLSTAKGPQLRHMASMQILAHLQGILCAQLLQGSGPF